MNARQNRIVFLGTGTSSGIPVIGCKCPSCSSNDPRDKRTRISALLQTRPSAEEDWSHVLLDTSIDLRRQLLDAGSPLVSHVAYTHEHVDHFFGLDELRSVQYHTREPIYLRGSKDVLEALERVYRHLFAKDAQEGGGILAVDVRETEPRFRIGALELETLPILHGQLPIQGYRWGGLAYVTDCSHIPETTWGALEGLDVLVLGMLRKRPHGTHFNLDQALEVVERARPKRTYFIHMTHDLVHEEIDRELPENVRLAYDGLTLDLDSFDPVDWRSPSRPL